MQNTEVSSVEWDLLGKKERKKFVNLALDKLAPDYRLILVLYYIAEKQISEICGIMGMKKSAIKMRLLRGRKQVEAELVQLLGKEIKDLYEQ